MTQSSIAAIFDVDGTLLAGASMEMRFLKYLWRYGELRASDITRLAAGAFRTLAEGRSVLRANKAYLSGKPLEHYRRLAQDCFDQHIKHHLLPKAVERVRWHQHQGHAIVLLSGSLELLVEPLAQHLNADAHIATRIVYDKTKLVGKIAGEHPYNKAKVTTLLALNQFRNFDLAKSFAYGNHHTDRHVLGIVGNPVATNPDRRLRQIALDNGWMIEEFTNGEKESAYDGIGSYNAI
ncbi:MAG: HAD-IB family hydrolase [Acidobacteria bacterium]|nr:HAD-IB family hydrolase [Acidobacteriota bacterium]